MNNPWSNLPGKHCYDILYLDSFCDSVAHAFTVVAEKNCDVYATLDAFLGGSVFESINYFKGNPRYLNMSGLQLLECISFDDGFDWEHTKKKEDVDWTIAPWVGRLLTVFHWQYTIDFKDWLKYFSTKDVFNMYYPLHEASFQTASEKLYEMYQNAKGKKHKIITE